MRASLPHALCIAALLLGISAQAAEPAAEPDSELAPAPEPPVIPEAVESGQPLEPEVTIIQRDSDTVQEYRLNGRLYMVKITPSAGPSYYLIDTDGDGQMETRQNDLRSSKVPQWVIFSWD